MPKLSIIIPVYNVEKYLKKCLDSIFLQNTKAIEVLCVDDGSTDNSLQILNKYKEKYSNLTIISQENGGTATARNRGIKEAKGDYVWFVDSDDWILDGSISFLLKKLENFNEDVLCFNGKLKYEDTGKEEQDKGVTETNLTGWEYYNKYALQSRKFHFVCVVLRLYKRQFLLENKLFFEAGISHEDDIWIPKVMYYAKSVSVIPEILYVYRIRQGSKMQTLSLSQVIDLIKVANVLSDFFIPKKNIDKSIVYREIAGDYFGQYVPSVSKIYNNDYSKIKEFINWKNFKKVSTYSRHKKIYTLIKINPILFRVYLFIEAKIKHIVIR